MQWKRLIVLIHKEFAIELRQLYAVGGMLLYLVSSIFVIYMAITLKNAQIHPITWNAVLWIIMLFTAVNSIAKSFVQEKKGMLLYFYTICSPVEIILAKIIYNTILMTLLISIGILLYSIVLGNPVQNFITFSIGSILGALGFAASFTTISSIASKASNSSTLMAILGFPIILPILLLVLKISKNAIDDLPINNSYDDMLTLSAIVVISITSSLLLFPYLWKSS